MQALLAITFSDPECVITVVGQDIPNLKKGPIRDTKSILSSEGLMDKFDYNKSDRVYTNIENGALIEFNSYDDEQDAKSGRRDYAFFNEANGIPYDIFDAIKLRTKKTVFIDFNPNARFWVHDKIQPDKENRKWFQSTFRNNPFIDDKIRNDILGYEPTEENKKRGTSNEYKWKVYGLGEVGRLEGLVFPDWKVEKAADEYKWRVFGLDFGFTNDPTTLIEIRYAHGNLYWKQHIYETGLTNHDIADEMKRLGIDPNELIIADSAEPKSIEELRRCGYNVKGAIKGADSINQGIDAIKRYNSYIDPNSKDLIEEFSSYTWKKDRNGNALNKPIDKFNHGIDAGRYALSRKILKPKKELIISYA